MNSLLVPAEVLGEGESLKAYIATVEARSERLSRVGSHMFSQLDLSSKHLIAERAEKGFETAVRLYVHLAVLLAGEPFLTYGTLVRFLTVMGSHVHRKVPFQGKDFVAFWTGVFLAL